MKHYGARSWLHLQLGILMKTYYLEVTRFLVELLLSMLWVLAFKILNTFLSLANMIQTDLAQKTSKAGRAQLFSHLVLGRGSVLVIDLQIWRQQFASQRW